MDLVQEKFDENDNILIVVRMLIVNILHLLCIVIWMNNMMKYIILISI